MPTEPLWPPPRTDARPRQSVLAPWLQTGTIFEPEPLRRRLLEVLRWPLVGRRWRGHHNVVAHSGTPESAGSKTPDRSG